MAIILGIDLGTSSVKALLLDSEMGVINVKSKDYDVEIPKFMHAEQDPELWWKATLEILLNLKNDHPSEYACIEGIGFSGQMHGLVVTDNRGQAIRPAIIWLDQRSENEVIEIQDKVSKNEIAQIMHNPVYPGYGLPSLLWLKNNEPENYKRIYKVMSPKDYLRFRMTGELGTDVSDASSFAGFDVKNGTWAYDIIERLEIETEIFPECHYGSEIAGHVTSQCEFESGLREGIPVVYGAGDLLCASIGNGVISEGVVLSNIGTGGQLAAFLNDDCYDEALRVHTVCHGMKGAYLIYGASLNSGLSLKWLKENVLKIDSFQEMSLLAKEVEPTSDGLIYLPYLTGERTPHMNPLAKGMFFGLTLSHDRRHMIRAVMEGVVFGLKESLEIFKSMGIKTEKIIASGGGAGSDVWLQIQADILGLDVQVSNVNEQACIGACIVAGVGLKHFDSFESAVQRFATSQVKVYKPIPENVLRYQKAFEVYASLYSRNKDLFQISY